MTNRLEIWLEEQNLTCLEDLNQFLLLFNTILAGLDGEKLIDLTGIMFEIKMGRMRWFEGGWKVEGDKDEEYRREAGGREEGRRNEGGLFGRFKSRVEGKRREGQVKLGLLLKNNWGIVERLPLKKHILYQNLLDLNLLGNCGEEGHWFESVRRKEEALLPLLPPPSSFLLPALLPTLLPTLLMEEDGLKEPLIYCYFLMANRFLGRKEAMNLKFEELHLAIIDFIRKINKKIEVKTIEFLEELGKAVGRRAEEGMRREEKGKKKDEGKKSAEDGVEEEGRRGWEERGSRAFGLFYLSVHNVGRFGEIDLSESLGGVFGEDLGKVLGLFCKLEQEMVKVEEREGKELIKLLKKKENEKLFGLMVQLTENPIELMLERGGKDEEVGRREEEEGRKLMEGGRKEDDGRRRDGERGKMKEDGRIFAEKDGLFEFYEKTNRLLFLMMLMREGLRFLDGLALNGKVNLPFGQTLEISMYQMQYLLKKKSYFLERLLENEAKVILYNIYDKFHFNFICPPFLLLDSIITTFSLFLFSPFLFLPLFSSLLFSFLSSPFFSFLPITNIIF